MIFTFTGSFPKLLWEMLLVILLKTTFMGVKASFLLLVLADLSRMKAFWLSIMRGSTRLSTVRSYQLGLVNIPFAGSSKFSIIAITFGIWRVGCVLFLSTIGLREEKILGGLAPMVRSVFSRVWGRIISCEPTSPHSLTELGSPWRLLLLYRVVWLSFLFIPWSIVVCKRVLSAESKPSMFFRAFRLCAFRLYVLRNSSLSLRTLSISWFLVRARCWRASTSPYWFWPALSRLLFLLSRSD